MRFTKRLALVLAVAGTAALSSPSATAAARVLDPGPAPWQQVPSDRLAEECGLDPALMRQASARYSPPFTVVRHGKLCWVSGGAKTTSTYHVASVTKTFGATLFGMIAQRSSHLADTDPVTEWIPANQLDGINPKATLAHVLAMTSTKRDLGTDKKGNWSYDVVASREVNQLIGVLNKAIAKEPEKFPGVTDVKSFAQREVFDVLGMKSSNWAGTNLGYSLNSTTQDISRLGLLWLRKGAWDGKQLLSEQYVYRMSHPAFEDTNTGYGYLTQMNAHDNWDYSSGSPDKECSPYATWRQYPHAPFNATTHNYGGSPFTDEKYDVGLFWAAGAGGQRVSVHRALDMVITVRDDITNNGHRRAWEAIRPALVALDPVYKGDEKAFCAAYQRSQYAPTLTSPWPADAGR